MAAAADIAIVIPAYNAAEFLRQTLPDVCQIASGAEVIVVDAGSTDATADVAREFGARVISLPQREGPARARNTGVDATDAEIVLFLDSDCRPHADVVQRVRAAFEADPQLVGLTGSYDTRPPEPGFFSQYMNLRHHFTHQRARTEDATFWAGCGAVRRAPFQAVGGFDAERFPRPLIEDIELRVRLREVGHMRLDPELQVTHLKRWTLRSVIETDIRCRAIPWARLILETGEMPNDLNVGHVQRLAAALAPLALAAPLAFAIGLAVKALWLAVASLAVVAVSIALHREMLVEFTRIRGVVFASLAVAFQQVHLTYSAATMALCTLAHFLRGARSR
jgi:GT2 family glycosyltransferase